MSGAEKSLASRECGLGPERDRRGQCHGMPQPWGEGTAPRRWQGALGDVLDLLRVNGPRFGARVELGPGLLAFGECVSSPREGTRA